VLGVAGSGEVGTASSAFSVALSGVAASGAVSTMPPGKEFALTGNVAVGNVGTVGLGTRSLALSGVQASGSAGDVLAVYWKLVDNSESSNWALVETD
jgi:hypothetical protein